MVNVRHARNVVPGHAPVPAAGMRSITILGATGSIGTSTVDLIKRNRDRYQGAETRSPWHAPWPWQFV